MALLSNTRQLHTSRKEIIPDATIQLWRDNASKILKISNYAVVDSYFTKHDFVNDVSNISFTVISKLRSYAVLSYLYQGERIGKRGRLKAFDRQVEIHAPNPAYLKEVYRDDEMQVDGGAWSIKIVRIRY